MPTIHLVRHGAAAAGFGGHPDPGLSDLGRAQAEAVATALRGAIAAPILLYSSPLARARETASPLAAHWGVAVAIEPRIGEIPSPTADIEERGRWLRGVMARRWRGLPDELLHWREAMIDWALALDADAVAFCHFVAINILVGAATGTEPLIVFRPDNGSVTRLGTDGGELALLELGRQADTRVN